MSARDIGRAAAVLAAAAVLLAPCLAAQGTKPRAVFTATTHDFGAVKQGDVVQYEFIFKNAGGAPLVIEKVDVTCGCTAVLVSEKTVGPGREGRLKATFDTRGYSGRLARYIYVISNDGENPRRELSLVADIEVPPSARIDVDRYNVDLGLVLEGEAPSAKVVVKSTGEQELKFEMSHDSVRFFSGGKPLAGPVYLARGASREIEIRFPPQAKTGVLRDYVLIKSNDPVRTTLSIYVSRYVLSLKELKDLFEKYGDILKK